MQQYFEESARVKKIAAIIVAAGSGSRVGGEIPKQYRVLGGKSVLTWSIAALQAAGVKPIIVVVGAGQDDLFRTATAGIADVISVSGGAVRTASVRNGLTALEASTPDGVLIHDAARPGLSPALVGALVGALEQGARAVAPALPVSDALKHVDGDMIVLGDAARDGLMRVQTPQAFRFADIRDAYARLPADAEFDDDLAVARAAGIPAQLIPGDARLMKLTYPEDFAVLENMLGARVTCVGSGLDAHRFGEGDQVTLCGVRIPHHKGLIGHSDADAGWHALVDAILGALGDGDIGAHFPPSDAKWKGANSEAFLRHARSLVAARGGQIVHVDVTLVCERPKIGPHRDAMRARTAEVLGLPLTRVSVKATTTERLGFLGREEGLAAQAVATLTLPV